jgi:hypothetical protein
MKKRILVSAVMIFVSHMSMAGVVDQMQAEFEQQSMPANPQAGKTLWHKRFTDVKSGQQRSCTSCHGDDLNKPGKHAKTGKVIEPMATTVNPQRFTERKKINKWFKRNCKWTLGRECTAREKADLLAFLKTL